MKKLLIVLFLFQALTVFPCGWGPGLDAYMFYSLFDQSNITSKGYFPFLRDRFNPYYQGQRADQTLDLKSGNIALWKELLKGWSDDEIESVVYASSKVEFQEKWKGNSYQTSKRYLQFAMKCSEYFDYRRDKYSWNYEEILKSKREGIDQLLEEGMALFSNAKNEQLYSRYLYQLVRILHYSGRYQEALDLFSSKGKNLQDEIYYYTLDQVAGCYYSLGQYEQAAYHFLTVFDQSRDRKTSAYMSYRFCVDKGAEGKAYFKGSGDQATYITLKNLSSFSNDLDGLQELYNVAPNDPKMELLFMRAVNNLEQEIWPISPGLTSDILPALNSPEDLNALIGIANNMTSNKSVKKKEFWQLVSSYLTFLAGNIDQAKALLTEIKAPGFQKQVADLRMIYKVFSWTSIDSQKEEFLHGTLQDIVPVESYALRLPAAQHLILDHAAHLYYKNGNLAKAYLLHNQLDQVIKTSSMPLIDQLIQFFEKPDKTEFEKLLVNLGEDQLGDNASDYLLYTKGLQYLRQGNPGDAYPLLQNNPTNTSGQPIANQVSAFVFSNNTRECFTCGQYEVMVDSVFLASVYSFIKPNFSKADLAKNLMTLEEMTSDEKQWKRKLAHYLLGNYYFNVSNTGYFRGALSGDDNCCDYNYFPYGLDRKTTDEYIESKSGYNLKEFNFQQRTNFDLADIAYQHYEKVLSLSTDRELNARCLYMMAKCELNNLYNKHSYYEYEGQVTEKELPYKKSFETLERDYKNTKFYGKLFRECSFFREYSGI